MDGQFRPSVFLRSSVRSEHSLLFALAIGYEHSGGLLSPNSLRVSAWKMRSIAPAGGLSVYSRSERPQRSFNNNRKLIFKP